MVRRTLLQLSVALYVQSEGGRQNALGFWENNVFRFLADFVATKFATNLNITVIIKIANADQKFGFFSNLYEVQNQHVHLKELVHTFYHLRIYVHIVTAFSVSDQYLQKYQSRSGCLDDFLFPIRFTEFLLYCLMLVSSISPQFPKIATVVRMLLSADYVCSKKVLKDARNDEGKHTSLQYLSPCILHYFSAYLLGSHQDQVKEQTRQSSIV